MEIEPFVRSKLVSVNVEFKRFGSIDTVNEKFQAEVTIESKWYEDEIITEYKPKSNWNPRIFIENVSFEKLTEDITYEIDVIGGKTLITEIRTAQGIFH